jgi:hypothetical protein
MRKHSPPFVVLTLLTASLTLLAGGDDFNLVRVALPLALTPTPGDSVPLDDPNTDFTEAAASEVSAEAGQARCPDRSPARKAARSPVTSTRLAGVPRASVLTPLRC